MFKTLARTKSQEVAYYDPHAGVEAIAKLESLEAYFKRAKDATGLYQAVEAKLGEQRRFVLWWDGQKHTPPGPKDPSWTGDGFDRLEDLNLDRDTVHRWRIRLKDPIRFDAALEAAQERCRRVCEAEKGATEQKGASGTGENEWFTPAECLAAARDVLGEIDLDPASSDAAQKIVQAKRYFTKEQDGLAQEWHGRVWLNPPYAQPHIADFVSKMVTEFLDGRVLSGIMLTHNYTDTAWFHEAVSAATAICFTRGRVKFYDAIGTVAAPTQGQAFFYFGDEVAKFAERFSTLGFIVLPWDAP